MFLRFWRPAMLAAVAALLSAGAGSAADTIRLGGKSPSYADAGSASTLKDAGATVQRLDLKQTDDEDLEAVGYRYGYRGFHYGGYRGFYGGYRGYYRPSFSINFGYYPRYYGYGYYPRYYGYGFYPRYYAPRYYGFGYYAPIVYGSYYIPIGGTIATQVPALTLEVRPRPQPMAEALDAPQDPMPIAPRLPLPNQVLPAPADGTFPYDGGPAKPVPMPRPDASTPPSKSPAAPAIPAERMVSIPAKKKAPSYPAYGDTKPTPEKADDATIYVNANRSQPR